MMIATVIENWTRAEYATVNDSPTPAQSAMERFQMLAITTAVIAYLLIVLDGITRIAGDQLGCSSSWPLCVSEPHTLWSWTAFVEYSFRGLAGTLAILLVWMFIRSLQNIRDNWTLPALAGGSLLLFSGLMVVHVAEYAGWLVTDLQVELVAGAQALLALLIVTSLLVIRIRYADSSAPTGSGSQLSTIAGLAGIAVFGLIVLGSLIATTGTGAACSGWPLCNGQVLPTGSTDVDLNLSHRWIALFATIGIGLAMFWVRRYQVSNPAISGMVNAAGVLMAAQIFIGAATVWSDQNPVVSAAHLSVATFIWALLVGTVALDRLLPSSIAQPAPVTEARPAFRALAGDYFSLTKPRIMILLLITTLGAMLIAKAGFPSLSLIFWTMLGGGLASGGASALNHYLDRDIDAIMSRTRTRPVSGGRVAPIQAAIFGVTLSILAVYVLVVFVNPLAAMLALAGNLFYVVIYTNYLKRATPQNIVIGGAAGAIPPLVGWAAVTNSVGVPALILFAIVFYWTPPHFWALALFKSGDYESANVPMFPAIYGEAETRRHVLLYTVMLVIVSLFPYALQVMGLFYFLSASVLGGIFLYYAVRLSRERTDQAARKVFFYSLWYLALIFLVMVIDRLIWF